MMNGRFIRGTPDQPVEGIDLPHEMALAKPADCRVARHCADGVAPETDQRDGSSHPRSGSCRLATAMSTADDNDIEIADRHEISSLRFT
jgi:hypothetical protein